MILSYLRRYSNAEDTLEGITRWWLKLERIDASVDEVADALESLRQKGIIDVHTSKAGMILYRIKSVEGIIAKRNEGACKIKKNEKESVL